MDAIYWLTYVVAPIVGGVLALAGVLGGVAEDERDHALAPLRAVAAVVLVGAALHDAADLVEIVGGLNAKGRALFGVLVLAQLALAALAASAAASRYAPGFAARARPLRERLGRGRRKLAALAIVSGLAMVLVRARVWLQIFS